MGGREHSVVVDPDSWTVTTERKNKTDSLLRGHMTEDTVKGRQQEGCGVQVWDRVMLSWAHGGGTFSWRHTSFSHLYLIPLMILHCTNKQIQIYIYMAFFLADPHQIFGCWLQQISSIFYTNSMSRLRTQQHIQKKRWWGKTACDHADIYYMHPCM